MRYQIIISIAAIVLVACQAKQHQQASAMAYDPSGMREFVVATASADSAHAFVLTDSLLSASVKDSAAYRNVTGTLEKYFGDPNSPYRNENLYIHLLEEKMRRPWCDSLQKLQYRNTLFLRMQNRPGNAANDFTYVTAAGLKNRMSDLHADFTLLYFYNPECEACKEMRAALSTSRVISRHTSSGKLKVLAIYTDRDEKLWRNHLNEMPAAWIQGRDEKNYLSANSVYDLKAIPSVYLLDKHKSVLLKDCMNVSLIEAQLH